MKILITGTAGFIGANLAQRLLSEGHEICGVDAFTDYYDVKLKQARSALLESRNNFYRCDAHVEDRGALERIFADFKPDMVVHLAAQAGVRYSVDNPRAYVDSNVVGSFNIVDLGKQYELSHLIMASTSSAYGANEKFPAQETDPATHPLSIYAATKLASELIAHSHAHLFGVPTTMVRFFSVYGPWGRPDMAFFKFTEHIFRNQPIDVFNHGKMVRDFTYVDDISRGLQALLETPPVLGEPVSERDTLSPVAPHRIVNIGSQAPVELLDYIREIETNVGRPAILNMMEMQPGDVTKTYADSTLLHELTGYTPSVGVEEGVRNFVDWYRSYYNPQ